MRLRLLQRRADDGARSVIAATQDGAYTVAGFASVRALAARAIVDGTDLAGVIATAGKGVAVDLAAELSAGRLLYHKPLGRAAFAKPHPHGHAFESVQILTSIRFGWLGRSDN